MFDIPFCKKPGLLSIARELNEKEQLPAKVRASMVRNIRSISYASVLRHPMEKYDPM